MPSPDDAPLSPLGALLALRHDPLVADMTDEQLLARVRELREAANNNAKLNSLLAEESAKRSPRASSARAVRQALLDEL